MGRDVHHWLSWAGAAGCSSLLAQTWQSMLRSRLEVTLGQSTYLLEAAFPWKHKIEVIENKYPLCCIMQGSLSWTSTSTRTLDLQRVSGVEGALEGCWNLPWEQPFGAKPYNGWGQRREVLLGKRLAEQLDQSSGVSPLVSSSEAYVLLAGVHVFAIFLCLSIFTFLYLYFILLLLLLNYSSQ